MKKFYFTAILLFLASIATVNAQLYMMGEATSGGWVLENATAMNQGSNGIYTWSGSLKAGDLKFVTTTSDFLPCYVATEENQPVQMDTPMNLVYRAVETENIPDFKFMFEKGNYTITVVTGDNPTMTVSAGPEPANTLYMIGEATQGGWDLAKATAMTYADGKYTWTGELLSGDLKFVPTNDFMPCYVAPVENQPVEMDTPMTLIYKESADDAVPDNKFMFEAGKYTIDVVLGDNSTMTVRYEGEPEPADVPDALYIVGNVSNWEPAQGIAMSYDEASKTFSYTGDLPDGQVKFLTSNVDWNPCYVAEDALTLISTDSEYALVERTSENESTVPDYKFYFYSGNYTVTADFSGLKPVLKVSGTINPFNIDYTSLCITGNFNKWTPQPMNQVAENVFEYTGEFPLGEANTFKFRWAKDWWPALVATAGAKTPCTVGGDNALVYMPQEQTDYDWQFFFEGDGQETKKYTIRVDLAAMTMTATEASTAVNETGQASLQVSTNGNNIILSNVSGEYMVCNLLGEYVSGVAEDGETVSVNVSSKGIYVVNANGAARKVMVY